MLEPQESKRTVATSSPTEVGEDINQVGTLEGVIVVGRKVIWHHNAYRCNKVGHLQAVYPKDKRTQQRNSLVENGKVHDTIQIYNNSKEGRYWRKTTYG